MALAKNVVRQRANAALARLAPSMAMQPASAAPRTSYNIQANSL